MAEFRTFAHYARTLPQHIPTRCHAPMVWRPRCRPLKQARGGEFDADEKAAVNAAADGKRNRPWLFAVAYHGAQCSSGPHLRLDETRIYFCRGRASSLNTMVEDAGLVVLLASESPCGSPSFRWRWRCLAAFRAIRCFSPGHAGMSEPFSLLPSFLAGHAIVAIFPLIKYLCR